MSTDFSKLYSVPMKSWGRQPPPGQGADGRVCGTPEGYVSLKRAVALSSGGLSTPTFQREDGSPRSV